jgi:hypothetical protein
MWCSVSIRKRDTVQGRAWRAEMTDVEEAGRNMDSCEWDKGKEEKCSGMMIGWTNGQMKRTI